MKNYLFAFFILLSISSIAQTKDNKLGLSVGGGTQNYRGDLGNAFKFKNESSYGAFIWNAGYYLNASFDAGMFGSIGDYGFCQTQEVANTEVEDVDRCGGCQRPGLGNLNSRLTSGGIFVKYKLSNGYLFKEDRKLKPFVYVGSAFNKITDIMKMNCVKPGNYLSMNAGLGFKYYLTSKINIGYTLALGYFRSDRLDFMSHGSCDMYMQNAITLGFDLF